MKIHRDGIDLHVQDSGPDEAPALVFSNSLGTDLTLWDSVVQLLPDGLRIVRYDMRGHGQSDVPGGPYTMGQLISDAETVCDALNVRDCIFIGLSVGGLIAQGLAVKRPDIIRAIVLSNTAAKIGTKAFWQDRINMVQQQGMSLMSDAVLPRWFGKDFYGTPAMAPLRDMLINTPAQGYAGVCAAIAGADFYTPTSGLRIPALGIAGAQDRSTPPDLVRETVDLIPGSQFALMQRAGHLPCAENPSDYAALLEGFVTNTGHVSHASQTR